MHAMAGSTDTRPGQAPDTLGARTGRVASAAAALVVRLRFLIVVAWIAAAAWAVVGTPVLEEQQSDVVSLVPEHSRAVAAESRAARLFRIPFSAHTAIVQRAPGGLSPAAQRAVVARAVANDRR